MWETLFHPNPTKRVSYSGISFRTTIYGSKSGSHCTYKINDNRYRINNSNNNTNDTVVKKIQHFKQQSGHFETPKKYKKHSGKIKSTK
jgi:hypothetical protein